MTDAYGHDQHPDLDALADLHADAPEATEAARAHVAGCAQCAAELARLDRVPALLAAAAAVGPMPLEFVTAVDAALAAEADVLVGTAESADADATAGPAELAVARTVTPLPTGRDRSPVTMRLLQAAAVVVLLFAGLGIGISAIGGGGAGDSSSAGGADNAMADKATESGAYPLTASGRDWTAAAVTMDAPKLLDGSLAAPVAANSLREQFSAGTRDDAGDGSSGGTEPKASAAPAAPESAARLAGGPALAQCVAELAGRPVTPLAVDIATWEQQPAAVIVLPAPGEPSRAEVWVVAPSCSTADAKLLYYANLPR